MESFSKVVVALLQANEQAVRTLASGALVRRFQAAVDHVDEFHAGTRQAQ